MKQSQFDRAYQLFVASPALWSFALLVPLFDVVPVVLGVKAQENVPTPFILLLLFYCGKFFFDAALYGSFIQLSDKKSFKPTDFTENGFKYFQLMFRYWAMVLVVGVVLGIVLSVVILILGISFDQLFEQQKDPFGLWNIPMFFLLFFLVPLYLVPFQAILTGNKLWVSLGETWAVYTNHIGLIFKFSASAYLIYLACLRGLYLLGEKHEGLIFLSLETLISSYIYVFLIPLSVVFLSDNLTEAIQGPDDSEPVVSGVS